MNGFLAIGQFCHHGLPYDEIPMQLFGSFADAEQWVEDYEPSEAMLHCAGQGPDWFEIIEFRNGERIVAHEDGDMLLPSRKGRDPETRAAILGTLKDAIFKTR